MPGTGTQIYFTKIFAFQDYLIHQFAEQGDDQVSEDDETITYIDGLCASKRLVYHREMALERAQAPAHNRAGACARSKAAPYAFFSAPRIVLIVVPQTEQWPLRAGLPFFMVTFWASFISLLVLHFTQ